MNHHLRMIELGQATVSIINVGDVRLSLLDEMIVPEEDQEVALAASLDQPAIFPTQCFHIALNGASILVDACDYTDSFPPDSPYYLPNYQPPPDLLTQLSKQGVRATDITHVIITHAHFDHYSAVTISSNGQFVPRFPRARYFLGQADWDQPDMQEALQDAQSPQSRTLGILYQQGMLELVEGVREIVPGIQIIPAPGESPGHQIVHLHSNDQTLYCLGDLYHDPAEVEHPNWMASWAEFDTNLNSRQVFARTALDEQALLAVAHVADIGCLEHTSSGVKWKAC